MIRKLRWCIVPALCAALGACSKSETPKADQKAPPQVQAPKASPPPEPPPPKPLVSGKGMPGASFETRVCTGVKKTLQQANERTPTLDVTTSFAIEVVNAFLDNPAELNDKMQSLDAAATSACPAERTKILTLLRKANLTEAFLNPADAPKTAGAAQEK